jgi:hypothetical protein
MELKKGPESLEGDAGLTYLFRGSTVLVEPGPHLTFLYLFRHLQAGIVLSVVIGYISYL